MKNNIYTLMLFLLVINVNSQVPKGFSFGAGINQTSLISNDLLAKSGIGGYSAGFAFNVGYHETFNYTIETMYRKSVLNLLYVDDTYLSANTAKYSLSTFDVGFNFNYYFIKPDEDKFYAGALVGFLGSFGGGSLRIEDGQQDTDKYILPYRLKQIDLSGLQKMSFSPTVGLVAGYNKFRFAVKYNIQSTNILSGVETDQRDDSNRYTGPTLIGKLSSVNATLYYFIL